jgi:zeaxanthin glucosyltransferase
MARIGVISTPVPGHMNPMLALACELQERGHSICFFALEDLRASVESHGVGFVPIGLASHPPGSFNRSKAVLGTLSGLTAIRFTINAVHATTEMICREAPAAIKKSGVELLIVDQMEPAGASVAQHLGIPYVTVANALTLNREPDVPPALTPWSPRAGILGRLRNRTGYFVGDLFFAPIIRCLNTHRRAWGLPSIRISDETFSSIAQISQLVPGFDFPRRELPSTFHYVGPIRKPCSKSVAFPYNRLNGKPLIYASLGTLQGGKFKIFELIASACQCLDVQLVITHGGGLTAEQCRRLPGEPIIVSYAPQLEILSRAALTITHAGLNTVLDSYSCGVPLVAMPITFEQPAIAERVRWSGGGEVLDLHRTQPAKLRATIERVLDDSSYRTNARRLQQTIAAAGGVRLAADLTLSALPQEPKRVIKQSPRNLEAQLR